MKKIFSFLSAVLLLCLTVNAQAQVNTYTHANSSGSYVEITGDTVVAVATTTTTSGVNSMDDSVYPDNLLPFSFNFNGINYSYVAISSNGFITFGATLPSGTSYVPISATTAYSGAISAYGRDLIGNRGITATRTIGDVNLTAVPASQFVGLEVGQLIFGTGIPAGASIAALDQANGIVTISDAPTLGGTSALLVATGSIVRGTTGAVGSRVHTIQFKRVRPWTSSANENMMNFQIKLYETSNYIEIVYGTNTNSVATTGQVGLRGSLNTDYNNRNTATANWATTVAGTLNTNTLSMSSTILPSSGRTLTWQPFIQNNNDVRVTANLAPTGTKSVGSPSEFPSAEINNNGLNNQNVPFYTVYKITGPVNYADSVAEVLNSGQSKTIVMPSSFSFGTPGFYNVKIYTRLPGDQDPSNDTLNSSFRVIAENYGSEGGYFFANNLAVNQPSYPRWGWKDTSGSKNLILNGVIQPGNTIVGGLDDGFFRLRLKDLLLAANQDTTDKVLKFNGICYDSIFPGTNGIIGLTQQFGTYSINDFNIDGDQVANNAILALWHDKNYATLTGGSNRLSYKVKHNQLLITYDRAVSFAPTTDWVTFQVVIEIAEGCASANSNWRVTLADTTNQNTSSSFYDNYILQTTATPPAVTNFRNFIMGWSGTGAPNVFAGYVSSGNPFPATPVTEVNVKRPIMGNSGNGLAIEFGPNQNELNLHDVVYLDLSLSLEGLQSNGRVRDTVEVIIRDGNSAPYKIMQRTKVFLDSAHNGTFAYGRKVIEATVIKDQYPLLLEVRHRNSITSWGNIFVANSVAIAYNFTTGLPQIYGNNGTMVNGAASYFAGDVNGDQVVDLADVALIDNDAFNFASGDYLITDVNWDGVVDLVDAAIADNNAFNFVSEVKYPGAVRPFTEEPVNYNYKAPTEIIILPDAYAEPKIDLNSIQNINIKKED